MRREREREKERKRERERKRTDLREADGRDDVIVRIVEVDPADLVGTREEEDALVADATAPILRQLHDVRTVAAERPVEAQQTQVRAVAVIRSARIGHSLLTARM